MAKYTSMEKNLIILALLASILINLHAKEENGVFVSFFDGHGGGGENKMSLKMIEKRRGLWNVVSDLVSFTGLNQTEVMVRINRIGRFHFASEHSFWRPTSPRELAWYYRGSVAYLFANAIHPTNMFVKSLTQSHGLILDYSGGVGHNVIYLASQGIKCVYFGIGLFEFEFARFRVHKRNLHHLVSFISPFNKNNIFDPVPISDMRFGVILAYDVFEHIPVYHVTLRRLLTLLQPGGLLCENSPFSYGAGDTAIHLNPSMPMFEAMGEAMQKLDAKTDCTQWKKSL